MLNFINKILLFTLIVGVELIYSSTPSSNLKKSSNFIKNCSLPNDFCIVYPKTFTLKKSKDNREWIIEDKNRNFWMRIEVGENLNKLSLKEEMKLQERFFDTLTYSCIKEKNNYFVLSGFKDGYIYYIKSVHFKDKKFRLFIKYKKDLKKNFDELVTHISHSFKAKK
ncbi:MAG: hypothetical protein GXO02_00485 [Epsilonproteobacteria bacterium]|nr:hypothetical protein [Campylobacterota bacterium]